MNKPLISIILPVYNGEQFLEKAIESCLSQIYNAIELIIVNDCSSDNTLEIAERLAKADERIKIINNTVNKKLPESLNIGHKQAKGNYITWTSDDNLLKTNCLQELLNAIIEQNADVVYANNDVIDENGIVKRENINGPIEHVLFGNKIGACFLYKKEVFNALDGYNTSLYLLEDYDFWLRCVEQFRVSAVKNNLYQYRIHSNSLTSSISNSKHNKNKHSLGIKQMFNIIGEKYNWNSLTLSLLIASRLNYQIDIDKYLKNMLSIEQDVVKFGYGFDKDLVLIGLKKCIRKQLFVNSSNYSIRTVLKVLIYDKSLLFHKSFSRKTTVNFILKSLFKL
ncbi:glycosyltransferase family 2 protein [Lutibacter sp.]|uniref:glycosyltransferase family 2 protein n=1 Tax=Lutibacter sp. TaxID=1925666 RepID=UPI00356363FB